MPMGSTFSIEQMIMQLSAQSRTTSISNSFQPKTDSSIKTVLTGDSRRPVLKISSNSFKLYAMPPPVPASVKEGRSIAGKPTSANALRPSSSFSTRRERGDSRPILSIASLKRSLSSAFSMASRLAPMSSTLSRSNVPSLASVKAVLRAVCPPIVGSKASGFSFSMIRATVSLVIGST